MRIHPFLFILLTICFNSCKIFNPDASDRKMERYVNRKAAFVQQASNYFISLDTTTLKANTPALKEHNKMLRKLRRIGNQVKVTYTDHTLDEEPDSTVIFQNWSFWRISEVMYDFSSKERDLINCSWGKGGDRFVKAGNRIYLRRRSVPLM